MLFRYFSVSSIKEVEDFVMKVTFYTTTRTKFAKDLSQLLV
ncbi:hypothetical protein [Clostridium kluyveri]|nr:hypothetical protein [Clostridium kluyveri]